ncbi:MAG: DUF488 family protein [Nanoarchaeota archaeon]|nr:DUF488 family protein [Nanoarchaeota archaeon]
MLYTKSIYKPKLDSDGLRISVMSRHTLNDGITLDPKITNLSYDLWLKILSPPDKLVGDYYKRGLSFEEYKEEYLIYLSEKDIRIEVEKLSKQALEQDITLLCVEESAEKCHRKILAEECQKYYSNLRIMHR